VRGCEGVRGGGWIMGTRYTGWHVGRHIYK
jgi:hypothetical protein